MKYAITINVDTDRADPDTGQGTVTSIRCDPGDEVPIKVAAEGCIFLMVMIARYSTDGYERVLEKLLKREMQARYTKEQP